MFVSHPLIRENTIESRLYQERIVDSAMKGNTLVVAPTALGKTIIAILLAAHRLERFPSSKVLMISTTRPLVNQHAESFKKFLKVREEEVSVFTGFLSPEKREEIWRVSKIICATPQVIENDLIAGRYSIGEASLVVFDEAHRATGDYPYGFIAQRYMKDAKNPLILALTASPGGKEEKIREVCENLSIKNIEIRDESDNDVKPYIKGIELEWRKVELPRSFKKIRVSLERALYTRLETLRRMGVILTTNTKISKKELLALRAKLQEALKTGKEPELYGAISNVAACINLSHALELLETQGLETLSKYFKRMENEAGASKSSKAVQGLVRDADFKRAVRLTDIMLGHYHHPKLDKLIDIIRDEPRDKKIIIFTQYRDSAQKIVESIENEIKIKPVRFVGQASKGKDKGLTQKQQLEILEKFKKGEHTILVATSVAEEGLDIPKVDLVVFYEPIPSEIRGIQRRGRTGRSRIGKVILLMTKDTRDEGFYWSGFHKERRMRFILGKLKRGYREREPDLAQKNVTEFY